ncbi:hypothetical protein MAUB1S_06490 [Mycolicibacterium aubagnense]
MQRMSEIRNAPLTSAKGSHPPLGMRWGDEFALDKNCDNRFGASDELPATGFTRSLFRRFTGPKYENRQCLVRFSNQGDNLCTRSFELDPSDIQQILERRKRSNDPFDQRRMATKEALPGICRILKIGRKQEKSRFLQVGCGQGNIPFHEGGRAWCSDIQPGEAWPPGAQYTVSMVSIFMKIECVGKKKVFFSTARDERFLRRRCCR